MAVTLLVTTSGCDVFSSSEDETFTVSGTIVNSTDRGVQDTNVAPGTDRRPKRPWALRRERPTCGQLRVTVSTNGYNETTFSVRSVDGDVTVPGQELLGPATVRGTVTDATTNEALTDAEVAFTFGGENVGTSRRMPIS